MTKTSILVGVALLAFMTLAAAQGQPAGQPPLSQDEPQGGPGARGGNITSTGETVPNPGASQSAGTTPLDKGVQSDDNKIQSSICKGC